MSSVNRAGIVRSGSGHILAGFGVSGTCWGWLDAASSERVRHVGLRMYFGIRYGKYEYGTVLIDYRLSKPHTLPAG